MADKYRPVKDDEYRMNNRLLGIMCVCIIIFIVSSVLWMVIDSDLLLGLSVLALSAGIADYAVILKRRKRGIYLISDDEYEQIDKEYKEEKEAKIKRKAAKKAAKKAKLEPQVVKKPSKPKKLK